MSIGSNRWFALALGLSALVHGALLMFDSTHKQSAGEPQPVISVQLVSATQAHKVTPAENRVSEAGRQRVISARNAPMQVKPAGEGRTETRVMRELHAEVDTGIDEPEEAITEKETSPQHESIASTSMAEQRVLSGEEKQMLLSLLHREINDRKQYPYLAQRQKRQGRVSLNFMLHPDGRISDIAIIESSRFGVLDHAAQSAIEKVSPFRLASRYLQQTELFNVDIEFRLN